MTRPIRILLESLGVPGVLGIGVLVSCASFYFMTLGPAERQLETQRSAASLSQARSTHRPVSTDARAEKLRQFHKLFPSTESLVDEVERLYGLAREAPLELKQGEYRLETKGAGLLAYRITLPVRGNYTEIRDFIGAVLADMRTASIDGIRFERNKAGDTQLEVQLRLTVYFQPQQSVEQRERRARP
jgi:hypothetical protein